MDSTTSAFVAGLAAALIAAVVITAFKKLRKLVWGNIGRFLKWLTTIRVTTTRRMEAAREATRQELRSQSDHLPKPRWVIGHKRDGGLHDWIIVNAANEGVVATSVSLDAPDSYFSFLGSADWASFSGQSQGTFRGSATEIGHLSDIPFTVSWTDAAGVRHEDRVTAKGGGLGAAYGGGVW